MYSGSKARTGVVEVIGARPIEVGSKARTGVVEVIGARPIEVSSIQVRAARGLVSSIEVDLAA